jgi:hypothetical protein
MKIKCNNCKKSFDKSARFVERSKKHYCSRSCAAKTNNKKFPKRIKIWNTCKHCSKTCHKKFCSHHCQQQEKYVQTIALWQIGKLSGLRGSRKEPARWVYRYMFAKAHGACEHCGWRKKHPVTGQVPLQLHHIDGNFQNTVAANLELLCPNCHSLTTNFGALNKNAGRRVSKCM